MASKGNPSKNRRRAKLETTFDLTATVEKSFEQTKDDEEGEDGPLVFVCGKCKLPVGDSLSWDGSEDSQNQIRLKRVTEHVLVGEENRLFEVGKRCVCLVVDLSCRGCHSVLGMVYASTPKSLDHKRFTFCLNVGDIESYVLGSASQVLTAEGPEEQPVTLEYRSIVEQQLSEMKMLVMSMALKLEENETGLQDEPSGCDDA